MRNFLIKTCGCLLVFCGVVFCFDVANIELEKSLDPVAWGDIQDEVVELAKKNASKMNTCAFKKAKSNEGRVKYLEMKKEGKKALFGEQMIHDCLLVMQGELFMPLNIVGNNEGYLFAANHLKGVYSEELFRNFVVLHKTLNGYFEKRYE